LCRKDRARDVGQNGKEAAWTARGWEPVCEIPRKKGSMERKTQVLWKEVTGGPYVAGTISLIETIQAPTAVGPQWLMLLLMALVRLHPYP
jgi:hypothetical protein